MNYIEELWAFFPIGYTLTVMMETPVLWLGLSKSHTRSTRLIAGFWLTACSYPLVALVFPILIELHYGRTVYLLVAETWAPVMEVLLFRAAFPVTDNRWQAVQDAAVITSANLFSFLAGGILIQYLY